MGPQSLISSSIHESKGELIERNERDWWVGRLVCEWSEDCGMKRIVKWIDLWINEWNKRGNESNQTERGTKQRPPLRGKLLNKQKQQIHQLTFQKERKVKVDWRCFVCWRRREPATTNKEISWLWAGGSSAANERRSIEFHSIPLRHSCLFSLIKERDERRVSLWIVLSFVSLS